MNVSADSMTADQLYHDSSKSTNKKSGSRVNSSGMDMNAMVKGSKVLPRMGRSETLLSEFRHRVDSDPTELQTEQAARNQRQRHSPMSEHLQRNKEETLLGNASERLATRARAGSNAEHRMIGSGDRKLASSLSSVDRQRLTSQLAREMVGGTTVAR